MSRVSKRTSVRKTVEGPLGSGKVTAGSPRKMEAGAPREAALLTAEEITKVMAAEFERQFTKYMETMRKEMREVLSVLVEEAVSPVRTEVASAVVEVREQGEALKEVEETLLQHGDQLASMGKEIRKVMDINKDLRGKMEDLEKRSRRQNVRIVGLPEGVEGPKPTEYFAAMLAKLLGEGEDPSRYELDWAHRSWRPVPKTSEPPRVVTLCFRRYSVKEKVLCWAKHRRVVQWAGAGIRVYQDFTVELARRRAAFNRGKRALYISKVQCRIAYPAKLRVTYKLRDFYFGTAEAAEEFAKAEGLWQN
ncbi:uncharacterized protein [Scyliorhinus torazame]|uniref:uncharacterized protein n=1 Tax=Scyliorhinus torazame TaxID=75743 RepID=UPI003B5C6543